MANCSENRGGGRFSGLKFLPYRNRLKSHFLENSMMDDESEATYNPEAALVRQHGKRHAHEGIVFGALSSISVVFDSIFAIAF